MIASISSPKVKLILPKSICAIFGAMNMIKKAKSISSVAVTFLANEYLFGIICALFSRYSLMGFITYFIGNLSINI